jgi:hypothetical protein
MGSLFAEQIKPWDYRVWDERGHLVAVVRQTSSDNLQIEGLSHGYPQMGGVLQALSCNPAQREAAEKACQAERSKTQSPFKLAAQEVAKDLGQAALEIHPFPVAVLKAGRPLVDMLKRLPQTSAVISLQRTKEQTLLCTTNGYSATIITPKNSGGWDLEAVLPASLWHAAATVFSAGKAHLEFYSNRVAFSQGETSVSQQGQAPREHRPIRAFHHARINWCEPVKVETLVKGVKANNKATIKSKRPVTVAIEGQALRIGDCLTQFFREMVDCQTSINLARLIDGIKSCPDELIQIGISETSGSEGVYLKSQQYQHALRMTEVR